MASTDTPQKEAAYAPPAEAPPPPPAATKAAPPTNKFVAVDVLLRFFLFATTLTSVVVMATAKQTKLIPVSLVPLRLIPMDSKFNYSPALIYFVAALSVACLYSIITTLLSLLEFLKPGSSTKLLFHFVIFDTLLLGIVAAATGTAGGVGYVALRGSSHSRWMKICNTYDGFCHHLGGAIGVSLVSAILLVLLVWLSVYSLSKKIPK